MTDEFNYHKTHGNILDRKMCTLCGDWKETLGLLSTNLIEAGVRSDYADITASFLYNMYLRKIPLLIAGPSGRNIADALSLAVTEKTACLLDATIVSKQEYNNYNWLFSRDNEFLESDVVSVSGIFTNRDFLYLLCRKQLVENHFIVNHPFPEDLVIEPKSLYTYFFPLLSDIIIDRLPTNRFHAGLKKNRYEEFINSGRERVSPNPFIRLKIPQLMMNRLLTVLTDVKEQVIVNYIDVMYLFCLFPYAYATDQLTILESLVDAETGLSNHVEEQIELFL